MKKKILSILALAVMVSFVPGKSEARWHGYWGWGYSPYWWGYPGWYYSGGGSSSARAEVAQLRRDIERDRLDQVRRDIEQSRKRDREEDFTYDNGQALLKRRKIRAVVRELEKLDREMEKVEERLEAAQDELEDAQDALQHEGAQTDKKLEEKVRDSKAGTKKLEKRLHEIEVKISGLESRL